MIRIADIIAHLESVAPAVYQEGYDNAGLIVGDAAQECTGVLTCLDSTEAIIEEAIAKGCNLIVAHHPIVFKGLKRFTGRTYVQRVVMAAIRHNIAIYAIHTNLDNVYAQGVNAEIARRIGLVNTRILAPKANMQQATIWVGAAEADALKSALQESLTGAQTPGPGVRQLSVGARPEGGVSIQLEVAYPVHLQRSVERLVGQYESADAVFQSVQNTNPLVGSGMVGELPQPMEELPFLEHLKKSLEVSCVKYTALRNEPVKTVALCGGAGGFLLRNAISSGAQVFITADYKYHEFFDADGKIIIADVGHYESEQFTINLLATIIREKFGNFAVHLTEVTTNPVNYL